MNKLFSITCIIFMICNLLMCARVLQSNPSGVTAYMPGMQCFVDTETGSAYIGYYEGEGENRYRFIYPYYSSNGKLCKYIDGEYIELD